MPKVVTGTEHGVDVEIYYEDFGTGQPVLLIHGWPLSGRAWELQVPALLDAGYRVITMDRRGFGQSSQPRDGYNYDTFAADVEALLTALDLSDVVLVGHSMAGGELARYVGNYGTAKLSKLVFANAIPPYMAITEDNPDGALRPEDIKGLHDGSAYARPTLLDGFISQFFTAGGTELVDKPTHDYFVDIARTASPKGTIDCVEAFSNTDLRGDLPKIDIPTLFIHGDSDLIVPFEHSGKRAHETVTHSELVVLKNGPHGAPFTHAVEWNTAVIDFLGK